MKITAKRLALLTAMRQSGKLLIRWYGGCWYVDGTEINKDLSGLGPRYGSRPLVYWTGRTVNTLMAQGLLEKVPVSRIDFQKCKLTDKALELVNAK